MIWYMLGLAVEWCNGKSVMAMMTQGFLTSITQDRWQRRRRMRQSGVRGRGRQSATRFLPERRHQTQRALHGRRRPLDRRQTPPHASSQVPAPKVSAVSTDGQVQRPTPRQELQPFTSVYPAKSRFHFLSISIPFRPGIHARFFPSCWGPVTLFPSPPESRNITFHLAGFPSHRFFWFNPVWEFDGGTLSTGNESSRWSVEWNDFISITAVWMVGYICHSYFF